MSTLLQEARDRAVETFKSKQDSTSQAATQARKQLHSHECVTACLRLISPFPNKGDIAPDSGLTWSETLLTAASYSLYLLPIVDTNLLTGKSVLLAMHNKTLKESGHAYLVLSEGVNMITLFDPATGQFTHSSDIPDFDWTYMAVVYRP